MRKYSQYTSFSKLVSPRCSSKRFLEKCSRILHLISPNLFVPACTTGLKNLKLKAAPFIIDDNIKSVYIYTLILQHIILHKAVIKRKYSKDVNIEEWITCCSVKHDFVTINDIEMSFFMRKANRATQKISIYKRDFFS